LSHLAGILLSNIYFAFHIYDKNDVLLQLNALAMSYTIPKTHSVLLGQFKVIRSQVPQLNSLIMKLYPAANQAVVSLAQQVYCGGKIVDLKGILSRGLQE